MNAAERFTRLAADMAHRPPLLAAACAGQWELFDEQNHDKRETATAAQQRHTHAALLCAACPELDPCRRWADGLTPRQRPPGVLAGQIPVPARPPGRPPSTPPDETPATPKNPPAPVRRPRPVYLAPIPATDGPPPNLGRHERRLLDALHTADGPIVVGDLTDDDSERTALHRAARTLCTKQLATRVQAEAG